MFSLFGKRKPAETPTEEAIQGPADPPKQTNGDDFIFVERKTETDPAAMYPAMPPTAYRTMPYPPPMGVRQAIGATGPNANTPIHYLQDIPFELSPQLSVKDRFTGTQMQIDGIVALMTRQLSVDALAEDYTFTLERSVQNECF